MAIGITCCSIVVVVLGGGIYLVHKVFNTMLDDIELDIDEEEEDGDEND